MLTLFDVGEQDWLERGHGGAEGLRPLIKGSAGRVGERASIRSVLRGADAVTRRRGTRRRTKALVGWMLYCCTAVGGMAAAFTVRDTLFPSLGAPTTRSLWVNSTADTTAVAEPGSTSSAQLEATVVNSTEVAATVATTQSSLGDQSVDSSSSGPGSSSTTNTIDDHGGGGDGGNRGNGGNGGNGGNVPETGTTLAGPSSSGNGGPVTTIDAGSTGTSTPDTSPGHQSGKGKGGGSDETTP